MDSDAIDLWVSEFLLSTRGELLSPQVRDHGRVILGALLESATGDGPPEALERSSVKAALLETVSRLRLPDAVRQEVPSLCRDFLEELEVQGRLAGGRELAQFVHALGPAFLQASDEKPRPIVSAVTKLGRNDPCSCGSGKKYKKCCKVMFDEG